MSSITSTTVSRHFQRVSEAAGQTVSFGSRGRGCGCRRAAAHPSGRRIPARPRPLQQLISRRLALASRELDEGDHNRKHIKNIDRQRKVLLDQASAR